MSKAFFLEGKDKQAKEELNKLAVEKLRVDLEVKVSDFSLGYVKGYVEGFLKGSKSRSSKETELCFVTKITLEENEIGNYEYCEVIKTGEKNNA